MKHLWITAFLCTALLPRLTMGQCSSSQERPTWVDGYFQEETYSYIEAVTASGPTEDDARNKAAQILVERRSLATGSRMNVKVQNGNFVVSGADELTVKIRVVDEYREWCGPGEYRVSLLVQTAKNPTYTLEAIKVTKDYDFSPRVFVPGMAQLHKGSTVKGILFIAGEVAFIGGIVVSEGLRASYEAKINTTHNASDKQRYIDNASNMENVRNICIAGAAAVYVWNVIDGIVAKGKKHIVIGGTQLSIVPYLSPYNSGLTLSLNF